MRQSRPLSRVGVLVATALLTSCGREQAEPVVPPAPPLQTLVIAPQLVARERSWEGVVQAVQQATLAAQTAGRVVELPVDVNDYVQTGDVLVRFTDVQQRSGRAQAAAGLRAARAQSAEADAEYRRIADLAARRLVARSQLDQTTARRDAARAALAAAEAGMEQAGEQVDHTVVRAPYPGLVTQRHVEVGETVVPGQPLISGLSLGQLRVEVQVPQADIASIRRHKAARVRLPDGRDLEAREVVVFPAANPQTLAATVRIELPESETRLMPGNTVKVLFRLDQEERLMLPLAALVRRGEIAAVYVVSSGGGVVLRQVRTGKVVDDKVEVLAGLVPGEAIALDPVAALGAQRARRGAADE